MSKDRVAQTSPDVCVRSTGSISLVRRSSNRCDLVALPPRHLRCLGHPKMSIFVLRGTPGAQRRAWSFLWPEASARGNRTVLSLGCHACRLGQACEPLPGDFCHALHSLRSFRVVPPWFTLCDVRQAAFRGAGWCHIRHGSYRSAGVTEVRPGKQMSRLPLADASGHGAAYGLRRRTGWRRRRPTSVCAAQDRSLCSGDHRTAVILWLCHPDISDVWATPR